MQKLFRSLIHEKLPLELRFELELLSRKRNLVNDEKFDKIIRLLRDYEIPNVVQLGPGTNRYAVKIDGYVLKISTDNDGRIDNLKEFKMAKRLYPRVTKIHEVSENGTLLTAEYISPFTSYAEMLQYADAIRRILSELSSTYLIGDVGITSKNFSNWGLRAGSNIPVCLDFAYIYEISSELFVCRRCNTNSMLLPDKDFVNLHCSNPACGHEYKFEDIRARIGNDLHKHEIGDLKEEGYYLRESGVYLPMDSQRSNYIKNNKTEETDMRIEAHEIAKGYYQETKEVTVPQNVIKATASSVDTAVEKVPKETIIKATAVPVPEEVAFSFTTQPVNECEIIQKPITASATTREHLKKRNDIETDLQNSWFRKNIGRAISKISNRITDSFRTVNLYEIMMHTSSINGNLSESVFYKELGNSVYHSLTEYCGFVKSTVVLNDAGKYKKVMMPPEIIEGTPYEGTMVFIARIWNCNDLNRISNSYEMINKYREMYIDYQGIQQEWISLFEEMLKAKLPQISNNIPIIDNLDAWLTKSPIAKIETIECCNKREDDININVPQFAIREDSEDCCECDHQYDEEDEYEEEEADDEEMKVHLSIDVINLVGGDDVDVINISTPFAKQTIYSDVNYDRDTPRRSVDPFGWLRFFPPLDCFVTDTPEKYLDQNVEFDTAVEYNGLGRFVKMGIYGDKTIIGVYFIGGITNNDEEMSYDYMLHLADCIESRMEGVNSFLSVLVRYTDLDFDDESEYADAIDEYYADDDTGEEEEEYKIDEDEQMEIDEILDESDEFVTENHSADSAAENIPEIGIDVSESLDDSASAETFNGVMGFSEDDWDKTVKEICEEIQEKHEKGEYDDEESLTVVRRRKK